VFRLDSSFLSISCISIICAVSREFLYSCSKNSIIDGFCFLCGLEVFSINILLLKPIRNRMTSNSIRVKPFSLLLALFFFCIDIIWRGLWIGFLGFTWFY